MVYIASLQGRTMAAISRTLAWVASQAVRANFPPRLISAQSFPSPLRTDKPGGIEGGHRWQRLAPRFNLHPAALRTTALTQARTAAIFG